MLEGFFLGGGVGSGPSFSIVAIAFMGGECLYSYSGILVVVSQAVMPEV
jgi:hypothetical protein